MDPALSGPMFSSPPLSTHAIDPPPAPMVVISIIGDRTTIPKSIEVCCDSMDWPLAIKLTSNDVPPISPVMTSGKPAAWAIYPAAMTPAAGPDSAVRTGNRAAVSASITPPLDWTIMNSPSNPPSCRADSNRARYPETSGCRYALSAVVENLSNSRISGRISDEAETCELGQRSRTASTAWRSLSALA